MTSCTNCESGGSDFVIGAAERLLDNSSSYSSRHTGCSRYPFASRSVNFGFSIFLVSAVQWNAGREAASHNGGDEVRISHAQCSVCEGGLSLQMFLHKLKHRSEGISWGFSTAKSWFALLTHPAPSLWFSVISSAIVSISSLCQPYSTFSTSVGTAHFSCCSIHCRCSIETSPKRWQTSIAHLIAPG